VDLRPFGSTALRVSAFGLGCARIGGIFQGDSEEFLRLLALARDAGINFFDTADMYSQGESESLLGRAFRRRRSEVILASKVGYRLPAQRRVAARLKPLLRPLVRRLGLKRTHLPGAVRGALEQEFSPGYLKQAVENSLRRLRTDHLDVLQLHSPPTAVIEAGAWEPALEELKRAGKIRYYGIAVDSIEAGLAALRFPGVSSLQFTLNLLEKGAVEGLLPAVRARRVGFIARECLANGLLIKAEHEVDLGAHCSTSEEALLRAEQLATLRKQTGSDARALGRLAIRFVHGTEGVSVTLLGARNTAQLRGLLDLLPSSTGDAIEAVNS
jgi:aryl-alcohol dehydrogenase-like predicted oxidoreductase